MNVQFFRMMYSTSTNKNFSHFFNFHFGKSPQIISELKPKKKNSMTLNSFQELEHSGSKHVPTFIQNSSYKAQAIRHRSNNKMIRSWFPSLISKSRYSFQLLSWHCSNGLTWKYGRFIYKTKWNNNKLSEDRIVNLDSLKILHFLHMTIGLKLLFA